MDYEKDYPWIAIHELLLDCGKSQNPHDLAVKILKGINALVPYDQGRIYSFGTNGDVCDDDLFCVDKRWPRAYYEYYSQILDGRYSLKNRSIQNGSLDVLNQGGGFYDWTNCKDDEFVEDYVRPQGIRYTFGFGLYDARGVCKRSCIIDRTGRNEFSEQERSIMTIIVSHLRNLHRNFYTGTNDECAVGRIGSEDLLTARESEIADLICKGYTPDNISKYLFVSRATVYKHIAHIHTKMGVSNRQELLVKLFHGQQDAEAGRSSAVLA
jgi:DNA-binding CsgD family transcriptional regulator